MVVGPDRTRTSSRSAGNWAGSPTSGTTARWVDGLGWGSTSPNARALPFPESLDSLSGALMTPGPVITTSKALSKSGRSRAPGVPDPTRRLRRNNVHAQAPTARVSRPTGRTGKEDLGAWTAA